MKRVIEQEFIGINYLDKEKLEAAAQYTWQKDEIAWLFNTSFYAVFKVKFTGERWVICDKWSSPRKIYQYEILESSKGLDDYNINRISHDEEIIFFTDKQEALELGLIIIERIKNYALKEYDKRFNELTNYDKVG